MHSAVKAAMLPKTHSPETTLQGEAKLSLDRLCKNTNDRKL